VKEESLGKQKLLNSEIGKLARKFGYAAGLRGLQEPVIACAKYTRRDVIFVGPTGMGKTLCYVIPAFVEKGITLVIQPYRALIASQQKKLDFYNKKLESCADGGSINTEKLHTIDDAVRLSKVCASTRLQLILADIMSQDGMSKWKSKCSIFFCTPELASSPHLTNILGQLSDSGVLTRIVCDEFDLSDSRKEYAKLVPEMQKQCTKSKFMFLSATISKESLNCVHQEHPKNDGYKPCLFISQRKVSDSLVFRVERKESDKQV
jgi:superfamily II DNA helicase RecQ